MESQVSCKARRVLNGVSLFYVQPLIKLLLVVLQVGVRLCGHFTLHLIWRKDVTLHIFGARDFPNFSNFAPKQTFRDNVEKFPEAPKAVFTRF